MAAKDLAKSKSADPSRKATEGRDEKGRILPGTILNPEGGRRGYAAKVRARLQTVLDDPVTRGGDTTRLDRFLDTLVRRAMAGDMAAAKLVLDRVLPAQVQADVNVGGMTNDAAAAIFVAMREHFAATGALPDIVAEQ